MVGKYRDKFILNNGKPKFIDIGTEGSIIESKKKAQKILFND